MKTLASLATAALALAAAPAGAGEPARPDAPAPGTTLPGYALGQPLAEARRVVPPGENPSTWTLRCSGDPEAPPELAAASAQAGGALVCWPLRLTAAGPVHAATLPRRLAATEELEFRHDRVVRITQAWRKADGQSASISYADPAGAR